MVGSTITWSFTLVVMYPANSEITRRKMSTPDMRDTATMPVGEAVNAAGPIRVKHTCCATLSLHTEILLQLGVDVEFFEGGLHRGRHEATSLGCSGGTTTAAHTHVAMHGVG